MNPTPRPTDDVAGKRIGVVGAGTMGTDVSHLFAAAGYSVVLVDVVTAALERARSVIWQNVRMAPLVRPSVPAQDPDEVVASILFTTDVGALSDVAFVVENVTEDWSVKKPLYEMLDDICKPHTRFGVNTSAIPITKVAAATNRPGHVIGTHFMNPASIKPTVEVIRGYHTSDETVSQTTSLLDGAGKNYVLVSDSPGFVTNRLLMLFVNEAVALMREGVAGAQEIDRLARECFGHAMGPLETADLIGLDTVLLSLEVLYEHLGDPRFQPSPLLRQMVDAGLNGRKSGQGFHRYEAYRIGKGKEKGSGRHDA